ncbi:MAG: amidohydrolase family protein [Acidimicrobiales bacterium]
MTIDVHAHCIPSALLELLRAEGPSFGMEVIQTRRGEAAILAGRVELPPFRPYLTDIGPRLAHMDATGVQVQLLSSWIDLTAYALEPASGAAYARRFNRILAEEAGRHPDRFLALATVPLQAPRAAAEELRFAVGELGMVGVEIATTVDGTDLDQAGLDPFWEAAAELRCLVLLHPYAPLAGVDLGRHFLDNLVGRPAETTIAVAHLAFSGVLDRHPGLVMCVVHGGGFFPYQLGRMRRGFTAVPHLSARDLRTDPEALARRLYYDTVLHSPPALAFLVDVVGAEHVVVGTDYPFEMGDPDPVATVGAIPRLSEPQRRLILEGNVRRILDGISP